MPTWSPELVVDEPLARCLVDRFPELRGAPLRLLTIGWDRTAWLVDEQWVFGFPRRQVVAAGVQLELELLPRLASQVPIAIPVPRFVGEPSDEFPWPFFGSKFIAGVEPSELDDTVRIQVGVDLARFLRALHAIDGTGLPEDGNRRADMRTRVPKTRESLAELGAGDCAAILDEAERLPDPPPARSVAHGDLHFRQVLVHGGRLSGVIDWVDVCRGDPSIDLLMLWSFVPPSGRAAFLEAYGDVRDDQLLRARVLALNLCAVLALFARDQNLPAVEREALGGLERTLL